MGKFFDWLRDVFKNDDIISPLTGETVEPPFFDPQRLHRTEAWTVIGYVSLLALMIVLSIVIPEPPSDGRPRDLPDLIFVMQEGPGGGGGGGGEQSLAPPSVQKIEGEDQAKIAVNLDEPEDPLIFEDPDKPVEPEPEEPEEVEEEVEIPEVIAPVIAQAPDDEDQKGVLEGEEQLVASAGSGMGGGAGTGTGTGIGEGQGSGIGEGTGGGYGGGAYRIGSGITSPVPVKQVQPSFTDDALARKVEGEVVVEIVILKDGTVQPVRVVRGLSADLNDKALEAASQWKFIPGKLKGQPVDVIAEIVVSFNIL